MTSSGWSISPPERRRIRPALRGGQQDSTITNTTTSRRTPMQTTVVLEGPADFGEGLVTHVVFVDSKFHVDGHKMLHIVPDTGAGGRDPGGNVATFQPDEWRSVVRGTVTRKNGVAEVEQS